MTEKKIEIPVLLSCERGNSAEKRVGKIKKIYVILNFSALDFLVRNIIEQEFQKCSFIIYPFLYIYPALYIHERRKNIANKYTPFLIPFKFYVVIVAAVK